jgi:hypothetical protein
VLTFGFSAYCVLLLGKAWGSCWLGLDLLHRWIGFELFPWVTDVVWTVRRCLGWRCDYDLRQAM